MSLEGLVSSVFKFFFLCNENFENLGDLRDLYIKSGIISDHMENELLLYVVLGRSFRHKWKGTTVI